MTPLLALAPIMLAIALLIFKQRLVDLRRMPGSSSSVSCSHLLLSHPAVGVARIRCRLLPLILEVALILLFGMLLARLLEAASSMSRDLLLG